MPAGKKGIEAMAIAMIILAMIAFLFAFQIIRFVSHAAGSEVVETMCRGSVAARGDLSLKQNLLFAELEAKSPLICTTQEEKLQGASNLEVMDGMADLVARCWWQKDV